LFSKVSSMGSLFVSVDVHVIIPSDSKKIKTKIDKLVNIIMDQNLSECYIRKFFLIYGEIRFIVYSINLLRFMHLCKCNRIVKKKKHSTVHGLFMVVYIQVASETCFLYYEPIKSINKHLIFSKFPCNPFSCLEGYRQMNYWTNRSPSIYTFAITSCV
jgi:hypothetical protein